MKLKEGFILRSVAGRTVVVPVGENLNLNLMITLNDTGRFLWDHLDKGVSMQELKNALMAEYEVDEATARTDVESFIENCQKNGFLE